MATSKKEKEQPPAQAALPEPSYPTIEAFIETASPDEVADLFADVKQQLATLKGPKAEQAKKVGKAIERTEELLTYLLEVREKIEAERKGKGGKRK